MGGEGEVAPGQKHGESPTSFVERMVGYARLWFAILVLRDDLAAAWRWLARTLNSPPAPVSVPLLLTAFEMTGAAAQSRYSRQFAKLVTYAEREYLPSLESVRSQLSSDKSDKLRADQARLGLWISNRLRSGVAPPPEGSEIILA